MPNRIDGGLDHADFTALANDCTVLTEPAQLNGLANLRQHQPRLGDRNGGTNVQAVFDFGCKILGHPMAPRIERHDRVAAFPLRVRPDLDQRAGILQIRPRVRIQRSGRHGECAVDRIGAAVRTDDIAVPPGRSRSDDRTPGQPVRRTPLNGKLMRLTPRGV